MNKFKVEVIAENVSNWVSMILESLSRRSDNNNKVLLISLFTNEGDKVKAWVNQGLITLEFGDRVPEYYDTQLDDLEEALIGWLRVINVISFVEAKTIRSNDTKQNQLQFSNTFPKKKGVKKTLVEYFFHNATEWVSAIMSALNNEEMTSIELYTLYFDEHANYVQARIENENLALFRPVPSIPTNQVVEHYKISSRCQEVLITWLRLANVISADGANSIRETLQSMKVRRSKRIKNQ